MIDPGGSGLEIVGLGIDCEELERWKDMLGGPQSSVAIRVFDEEELAYAAKTGDFACTLAGCWCAKEAVFKALPGLKSWDPRGISVRHDCDGRPIVHLNGRLAQADHTSVLVSISYTQSLAIAVALALKTP